MKGSRHVAVVLAKIHFTTQPFVHVANSAVSSQFFELFFSVLGRMAKLQNWHKCQT